MRRRVRVQQAEDTVRRLDELFPRAAGWTPPPAEVADPPVADPAPAVLSGRDSSATGWVPEPDRSWSATDLRPEDAATPLWTDRLRLLPSRAAALGLVAVAVLSAVLVGALVLRSRPVSVSVPVVESVGQGAAEGRSSATAEVVVSVVGTVRRPGLVRLALGARVDDAVRAAGGPTAGLGQLNVARKVVDGEQIVVGPPPPGSGAATGGGSASTGNGRLDLNLATVAELDALPGIGPVLAQRILDWRTEHGRFASVDQLREVPGIGESKYVGLKAKVAV